VEVDESVADLHARDVAIFPPRVLDAAETFFSTGTAV
jgi:hypothetical protein